MQNKGETALDVEDKQDMKKLLQELMEEEQQTTVTVRIVEGSRKGRKEKRLNGKK